MENVQQAFSKLANEEGLTLEERLIARKYFAMGHAAASRWIPIEEGLPEEGKPLQINDTIGGYKPYRVFTRYQDLFVDYHGQLTDRIINDITHYRYINTEPPK